MEHCRWAFIVSRFPKLTETFILRELLGLEARGVDFELYALIREGEEHLQPSAADLDRRAHYFSWRSGAALATQWHWLRRSPRRWARAWWTAVAASWRSVDALLRAPVVVLTAAQMARRMERQGIDRVHAHWVTYPTLAAMVIRDLAGIPFSVTGHAGDIYGETGGLAARVAAADAVFCCTEFGRRRIVEQVGDAAAKTTVIHHGVDLGDFTLQPPPPAHPELRVLCIGALQDYKGHLDLLDAISRLVDAGRDVELTLIGDGPQRGAIESRIDALGLGARVRDLGRTPIEEVRDELARCDVVALPSLKGRKNQMDGIPNVLVEALAVGRPVVATGLTGIRELIVDGETGVLSQERDPASVAAGIARLADDPELVRRVVAAGRARVEAEHDSARTLDELRDRLVALCPEDRF